MQRCGLVKEAILDLGRALQLTKDLKELNLAKNSFCRNCFAEFTSYASLEVLDLSENLNFGDQNGSYLFKGFRAASSNLKELNLRNTNITDQSFAALMLELETCKKIAQVNL